MKQMIDSKVTIRPTIKGIGSIEYITEEEKFQNLTLRPIIKLQHLLIIAFFQHHIEKKKINFSELNQHRKVELITNIFNNDSRFKTELRGLIIGLFTEGEYETYTTIAADANKRINGMIKERLLNTLNKNS